MKEDICHGLNNNSRITYYLRCDVTMELYIQNNGQNRILVLVISSANFLYALKSWMTYIYQNVPYTTRKISFRFKD